MASISAKATVNDTDTPLTVDPYTINSLPIYHRQSTDMLLTIVHDVTVEGSAEC